MQLASYGFIVVAIEHRDGSGPRTYINHPEGYEDPDLKARDRKGHKMNKGPLKKKNGYDVMVSGCYIVMVDKTDHCCRTMSSPKVRI